VAALVALRTLMAGGTPVDPSSIDLIERLAASCPDPPDRGNLAGR
jgi:hypothetical protein